MPGVNDEALGYDVNRIVQALTGVNIVPITTGNLTVTGNVTVSGTEIITGLLTANGGLTITGAITLPTHSVADSALSANVALDNINNNFSIGQSITGNTVITGTLTGLTGLTVTSGDLTLTAGKLIFGTAVSKIIPGATSISYRNNADSADNLLVPDNGRAVFRNGLALLGSAIDVPAGVVGYAEATSNQTTITTEVDITGLTVTWTAVAGRRYRTTLLVHFGVVGGSGARGDLFLKDGSNNQLDSNLLYPNDGAGGWELVCQVVEVPGAGSITRKGRFARGVAGTSTSLTIFASSTSKSFILVEDIGT